LKQGSDLFQALLCGADQTEGFASCGFSVAQFLELDALKTAALCRPVLVNRAQAMVESRARLTKLQRSCGAGAGRPGQKSQPKSLQFGPIIRSLEFYVGKDRAVAAKPARKAKILNSRTAGNPWTRRAQCKVKYP